MFTKLKPLLFFTLFALPLATLALERTALIPTDAQSSLHLSDAPRFLEQFKNSSLSKLWNDPQFQDFLGNPDATMWQELFFDGELDAEDRMVLEQLKMLSGEVILAFNMQDLDAEPYIIAAMSEEDFLQSLEMDEKLTEQEEDSFKIRRDSFQGVEIIQHIKENDAPSWQTHLNETFVMGHKKEWVEKCIVQLKKETIETPTGNPFCLLNLPLSALIREQILEDMKKEIATNPQPYDPELLMEALGLMGVKDLSFRIELKENEMLIDNRLQVSDLTKGIFTILEVTPSELPRITFVPENVSSLEVGRFNLLRLWQEIPTILTTAMPAAKPQFDMLLMMIQQQAGIDFEQDLLTHLGTKYVSFSVSENKTQISVMAMELKDARGFKQGLETLFAAPALQPQLAAGIETEPFLDHTLYLLNNPDEDQAFGVAGGYLIFGETEGLRQIIRSLSSETAVNSTFEKSALIKGLGAHVPTTGFSFGVLDWKQIMDMLIHELSKPEVIVPIQQKWATSGAALPPPDMKKLPSSDHIASFFNVAYQYIEATKDGLHQRIILKY